VAKKIGFVGNCQLGTLSSLYRHLLGDKTDIDLLRPPYTPPNAEQTHLIGSADTIVKQVQDFDQKIGELKTDANVQLFPQVSGAFLWPYAGQQHLQNATFPYFDESGPYPGEMGDSFLNKMISDELSVWIPADVVSELSDEMILTFELPDAARPSDFASGNTDDRLLGLAFRRLTMDRLDAMAG
jgi:hypothetical protein